MGLFGNLFNKKAVQKQPPIITDGSFYFEIEDVFTIVGRGTVATGRVKSGEVHVGELVIINGNIYSKVLGIELFRQVANVAKAGDACGLFLEGITQKEINKGGYITK